MNAMLRRFALVVPLGLALAGCVNDPQTTATSSVTIGATPYVRGDLGTLTYRAVDMLLAESPSVTRNTPLIVASVADTQHIDTTSPLGNIVSDMIRTRLAQDGHETSEIRMRREIGFNRGEGEFLLARNKRLLMEAPTAAAVVIGTYAVSTEKVYVSLKLVSATDTRIIAGADFVVPLHDVDGLLYNHNT